MAPALQDLAERGHLDWQPRVYAEGDLAGCWLAMACTADPDVNEAVLRDADAQRTFCLAPTTPAPPRRGCRPPGAAAAATVSVHGDRDPRRAAALRDAALTAVEALLREEVQPGRLPAPTPPAPAAASSSSAEDPATPGC